MVTAAVVVCAWVY